ncbi:MAG: glycosyltransferase [Methylorubrum rhodinum]|uniref:glycosyltransferase n=1 Tax=Methylorubrum rhodinum TaxID=29428 RepID=UPI003BB07999
MSACPGPAVVCVPARNEAERLPRLLRALADQDGFSSARRLRVVVVANNCTDDTVASVRDLALDTIDLRLIEATFLGTDAHVGTARRRALDAGAEWLEAEGAPDGVLLTTDADARLDPSWVADNLSALDGAEIVGGRLVIDDEGDADPALAGFHAKVERYWAGVRLLEDALDPPPHDPAPRHGDHTGGSLALRASLYRAVGGLPALPRGEDNALVAAVQRVGGRLRHCPAVSVRVSARTAGRAEGGMAVEMLRRARVVQGGEAYRLPTAAFWRDLTLRRARLRRRWREGAAADTLADLGLRAEDRAAILTDCPNDIAFVERTLACLAPRDPPAPECPLDRALADLAALAADLRRDAAA